MDRTIVYPGAAPLDTDILSIQSDSMIAVGMMMLAMYGTTTLISGLACNPTVPASMNVTVGQGSIISQQVVDANPFGSMTADSTDPLVKMGINIGSTSFTLTAPVTSGQSINYLIEASFQESDNTPVVLPYYNAANPSQPFSGPNNTGVAQNTQRTQRVSLQLKAGTPANTGTQVTPTVDANWTGLYVITINFAQTTITSSSISKYPNSPFLAQFLQSHHGGVPGQAPKILLQSEVQGALPLANLPTSGAAMMSNIQVFTSGGAFTVPAGVTKVKATVVGGGSGAGGCSSSQFAGPCGSGGGWAIKLCTVTPGQQVAVTVGVGGVGAPAVANSGAGGTSSFGSFCSATGAAGVSNVAPISGPASGAGSGGDLNGLGDTGSDGSLVASSSSTYWSGLSGGSLFGGSVRSGASSGAAGLTGSNYGAGGGAPYTVGGSAATGGPGHAGVVVVEW